MSLVEILVVIAILSLAIIPIFNFFHGQTRQSSQAGALLATHTHALELLDGQVDRLRAGRFRSAPVELGPREESMDWGRGKVTVSEWIRCRPTSCVKGLWKVEVRLRWKEGDGEGSRDRELAMGRLVSDPAVGWDLPEGAPR